MIDVLGYLTGALALVLPGFGAEPPPSFSGYVEADYVYPSAASGGVIESIAVEERKSVEKGDVLVVLASGQQQALLRGAEARVEAAKASWRNLETGSRQAEIEVIRAMLNKAQSDLSLARATLERSRKLAESDLVPRAKVDADQAAVQAAEAQVNQLQAQLQVAELPARHAQQQAAEASLWAAQAEVDKARADLEDRTIRAAGPGVVDELYYEPGEFAQPGVPLLSLLADGQLKVKFYVPEAQRALFTQDARFDVECDGCGDGLTARLVSVASQPQFTPPIIYSREERGRLVFAAEAVFDTPVKLMPGQPVSLWWSQ